MKAVKLKAVRSLAVETVPAPAAPQPGEVHIKVLAAGICGSDIHNYLTGQWLSGEPRVAGHEFCGTVLAVGAGVTTVAPGDRVVADSRFFCGECDHCRAGRQNVCRRLGFVGEVCDGGFAAETVLPERLVLRIDPAIDPRAGAMTEPLAVALHAIRRLGVPAGEPVLVAGCGTIGGLIAFCLSLQHQGPVLVADRNRDRAALVAGLAGASAIELTPGALSSIGYVFEATGNLQLLERLVENARSGGGIALVGISHGRLALDPNLLVEKETALIGCHAFASADLVAAAALVSQHAPRLLGLIAGQYSLDAVPAAYQNILSQKSPGLKSIVLPHD